MTFNISVSGGGTHAGWRRTKPQPREWVCAACRRLNVRYMVRCADCKAPRG